MIKLKDRWTGYWMLDAGCWMLDTDDGSWMVDAERTGELAQRRPPLLTFATGDA